MVLKRYILLCWANPATRRTHSQLQWYHLTLSQTPI